MQYAAPLDGIRALAALIVAGTHAHVPGLTGGFFGVDIFFVLSGYLITRLLMEEYERTGRIALGAFIARRLRRLWPALLLMLAAYVAVAPWAWPDSPWHKHVLDAILTALYLVNWAPTFGEWLATLGHVWSLAVEMQFYLAWPLLFLLLVRLPRRALVPTMVLLYGAATAWRWWGAEHLPQAWDVYLRTDMHCSGLLLGCLLAAIDRKLHEAWALVGLGMLLFAVTFFSTHWPPTVHYGFTIAEIGAALLVMSRPAWLGISGLAWLGRMSYGLYLWHFLAMYYLRNLPQADWRITLVVGLAFGLAAAVASHYLIERRFHRPRFELKSPPLPPALQAASGRPTP